MSNLNSLHKDAMLLKNIINEILSRSAETKKKAA